MDLRLNVTLQRSALISWSGWFWNRPDIQDKIRDISVCFNLKKVRQKQRIRNLVEIAKDHLKAINMPGPLYDRFVEMIITVGLRAISWYNSTSREYKSIPISYTRALHWTVLGTVDDAKIVENCWIPKLYASNEDELIRECDIYYMACGSILIDFINSNAERMLKEAELLISIAVGNEKWNFIPCSVLMLASPKCFSEERKIKLISKYFTGLNDRKEAHMFLMSVRNGHFIAARFYWQQLSSSEKEEKLIEAAGICFSAIHSYCRDPRSSSFTDILVFLLSQVLEKGMNQFFVTECNRIQFLGFRMDILNSLIRSYGWENYFFSVFDLLRSEMTERRHYYWVLQCIIDTLHERRWLGLDSKNTVYQQILSVVLSDANFEVDKNLSSYNNSDLLREVFDLFDFDVINTILEKYSDCRIDVLKKGKKQYAQVIKKKYFNLLREFMETVLRSEDELEWFRSFQIRHLYAFIREDEFHLADNLINVLGSSEEERKRVKHKMDFLSFTAEYFNEGDLLFSRKILNWGFPDEKEKIEYFDTFKYPVRIKWEKETPVSHFLGIFWRKDVDNDHFILSLSEFLNWFFESENASYKISKIFTETLLRNFFGKIYLRALLHVSNCFAFRKALQIIDALVRLCVPLKDIINLRAEITQNASEWLTDSILTDIYSNRKCWGVLDLFLDWIVTYGEGSLNYKKKIEFVKNLLLTRDGLLVFKLIVRSYFEAKYYICSWIGWAGGISEIEHRLYEMGLLPDDCISFQRNFQCLKETLEQFERVMIPLETAKHKCSEVVCESSVSPFCQCRFCT